MSFYLCESLKDPLIFPRIDLKVIQSIDFVEISLFEFIEAGSVYFVKVTGWRPFTKVRPVSKPINLVKVALIKVTEAIDFVKVSLRILKMMSMVVIIVQQRPMISIVLSLLS